MDFKIYENQFKALSDEKRLEILYELCQKGEICVNDMCDTFQLSQSKLSYHLKILLDAKFIKKISKGTWNYYELDNSEIKRVLSKDLCCIFLSCDCCKKN